MSGRIEMYDNQKETTSKWSRNESFAVRDAGVDIGEDLSSGPAGTTDYSDLSNKPSINSVELNGNKSLDDLYIQKKLTAGTGINITYDEQLKPVISQDQTYVETNLTAATQLGWTTRAKTYSRNGVCFVDVVIGTKNAFVEDEVIFNGAPLPATGNNCSLLGICDGSFYRFYVNSEGKLISRYPIQKTYTEVVIFGSYLC